jgi:HSP20 family molecular chaperone IbpA
MANSEFPPCSTSSAARFQHSAALTWRTAGFKADVVDKGDRYQVKAEMPGVKKD